MEPKTRARKSLTVTERIEAIGWDEVIRRPDLGACWEWRGGKHEKGYGLLHVRPKMVKVHRVMLESRLAEGLGDRFALHHCDNPPCIRPDHLFAGDARANALDAVAKGRHRHGDVRATKLTEDDIAQMRAMWFSGGHTKSDLARRFGVSQTHASQIVRGLIRKATS